MSPRDPRVLTLLTLALPEHLDPRFPEDALGASLGRLVFEGLYESDPRTFLPRPRLAARLDVVEPTRLRVTLRPDARFHDGTPVTARDVAATYDALLADGSRSRLHATYARVFRAVRAVDDATVEFTLHRPDGSVMSLLQQPVLRAVDAARGELPARAGDEAAFVGSGALRVTSFAQGHWRFDPAPGGESPPLRVVALRDPNTLALRLLHGEADVAELKPELFSLFEHRAGFTMAEAPSAGVTYLGFQCERGPLADRRVRQALAHAIDREGLRRARLGDHAVDATGMIPPGHWAYTDAVVRYAYDPARARALLDEAGVVARDGQPRLRLVLRVSSQRSAITVAQSLAAMLEAVGVSVDVRPSELATLLADLRGGRFDLTFLTVPDLSDPWGLRFWFGSESIPTSANPGAGGNRWRFRSAELDTALEAGVRALDPTDRAPHYRRAQQILAQELPVLPFWHARVVFAARAPWTGLVPRGDGQLDFLLRLRRQGR